MNITFHTLGCKVNQYETEVMRKYFSDKGYTSTSEKDTADVVVINSCTVTAESDRKTRQLVRRCRRENSDAVIVLTGCMAQAFPEDAAALCEADIVIGNSDPSAIIAKVEQFTAERNRIYEVLPHPSDEGYITPSADDFSERTRAYMKIEDGCDRFCSYCIIPKARGRVRSRSLEEIHTEAVKLADKGFCEIVLVGINLSAYGKNDKFDLCDAVDTVCGVEGIKRVRLGSLEPDHITDEMLGRFKAQEKFCPQFHLSLQSGCDETLKRMNRHYDSAFYYDLVTRIRRMFPDAAITTDIMVGFAGETDEEFEKSLSFAEKVGFAKAHIFMYSRREGTVAAALKSQVDSAVKQERSKRMIKLTARTEHEFLSSLCGRVLPVLFETSSDGFAEGYTANYSRVRVCSDKPFTGQIKSVKITKAENDHCIGELYLES